MMMEEKINVGLTRAEWDVVFNALANLPLGQVLQVFSSISQQVNPPQVPEEVVVEDE